MSFFNQDYNLNTPRSKVRKMVFIGMPFFVFLIIFFFILSLFYAPSFEKYPIEVEVKNGDGLSEIASNLYKQKVIKNKVIFKTCVYLNSAQNKIEKGDYIFREGEGVLRVCDRFISKDHGYDVAKITIPEGFTNKEIAELMYARLPWFSSEIFLKLAKDKEGKLFPDTYFINHKESEENIIKRMEDNYKEKMKEVDNLFKKSAKSKGQIIIMASIIEREANNAEDRRIVSGILWKRFLSGIPLQVDAAFVAVNGKTKSEELTRADLAIVSPFNTYKNKGLPPAPIANPGIDSILAALESKKTPYLFYLTGKDGKMYYSRDYEGHLKNKQKYLKR